MTQIYDIFIDEILTTIKKINKMMDGKKYEEFKGDYHLTGDVIRYLNIIGEASKHIPDEVKQDYQNVPWNDLLDLRDLLNQPEHIELVWNIATKKLINFQE